MLFAFLILVLGIFILFHVQKVEVKGNDYCSTEEIVKSVQNDKYSVNGLYVLAKYKLGYGKQPDCFESIKVSLKNPWTLKITVQEKARIGYVMDSDGKYYYFDQDGMVVDVEAGSLTQNSSPNTVFRYIPQASGSTEKRLCFICRLQGR